MEKKKKHFWRTVAGKTILFIVINISLFSLTMSVLASVFAISQDLYDITEQEYYEQVGENNLIDLAICNAEMILTSKNNRFDSMSLQIEDDKGQVLGASYDFDEVSSSVGKSGEYQDAELFTYNISLFKAEDGTVNFNMYSSDSGDVTSAKIKVYANPADFAGMSAYEKDIVHLAYTLRYAVYPIGIVSFFLCLAAFISLMCVSGMRPDSEEPALGPIGKVPFDLILLAFFLTLPIAFVILSNISGLFEAVMAIVISFIYLNMGLGLCVGFAARVRLHVLIKGSLTYKIIILIGKFIKLIFKAIISIPLIWRTILIIAGISFIELIVIAGSGVEPDVIAVGWVLEKMILCPVILYIAFMLRKLKISGDKMAQGDIAYRTGTRGLWGDFKKHAVNLNAVADSVTIAVEDRLKSERMKTELITNVSHDIKTPLTSIINYASLIGTTDPSDPKIKEYSEVIVRQSDKLKRLIEDLVEASKAQTGNLEIVAAPLDNCTFISQTDGEFKDKIENAGLTLISTTPEDKVMIMADGRRMMRIYDNLMNNICKYSQPGTRVYLSLEVIDGMAVTTFKNTSSQELNISADELVERFVRGDKSRNTEGNGLGLSIAQTLTELQGGKFKVTIDGDLFKVTLSFPVLTEVPPATAT